MCSCSCMCKCAMLPCHSQRITCWNPFSPPTWARDQTQAIRVGSRPSPTEPSHQPCACYTPRLRAGTLQLASHFPEESFSSLLLESPSPSSPNPAVSSSPTYTPIPSSFLGRPPGRQQCSPIPHIALLGSTEEPRTAGERLF